MKPKLAHRPDDRRYSWADGGQASADLAWMLRISVEGGLGRALASLETGSAHER